MATNAQHPFICFWALCMSSEKGLFTSFAYPFKLHCLSPEVDLCEFFMYFGDQTLVRGIIDKYIYTLRILKHEFKRIYASQCS